MKLTFLGTSAGSPTRTRNVTSLALQWVQQGALWLFDCGEGTQHQILRAPTVKVSQLERIFVTHMHGDHIFGLPGMLASRSLIKGVLTPVTLHGPADLETFVRGALALSQTYLRFPIVFVTVTEGPVFEDDTRLVSCRKLSHGIESFGYAIQEKPRPGEFDAGKARDLGIPAGPLYGRLKSGETITLPDGRTFDGAQLVGPPRPGRKVVICGDTSPTPATIELARDADVFVHEATFLSEQADRAVQVGHSTAAGAATEARDAGAKSLILTHFSARYESDSASRLPEMLAEARAIFPNTHLAEDFWTYEVSARRLDGDDDGQAKNHTPNP